MIRVIPSQPLAAAALLTIVSMLVVPTTARAEGSMGVGGQDGTRENWPCDGCYFHTPGNQAPDRPAPLMVAFHGDEGDPASYIEYEMPDETAAAGYFLLALKCPRDEGCSGSWYGWRSRGSYDAEWVGRQIDAVEAEYNVERNRIYLGGFSGGAYFLASYAPRHTERFAGVLYMGGGSGSQDGCPACKMPAYFLLGASDRGHIGPAEDTERFFRDCGHEVEFEKVPGIGHGIASARLSGVYSWFDARPHQCRPDTTAPTDPDGGRPGAPTGPAEPLPPKAPPDAGPGEPGTPAAMGQPGRRAYLESGCAVNADSRDDTADPMRVVGLLMLLVLAVRRR